MTHFVWLGTMNVALSMEEPKNQAGKAMCPCHYVGIVRTNPCSN